MHGLAALPLVAFSLLLGEPAVRPEVAVVVSSERQNDAKAIRDAVQRMTTMLNDIGLDAERVDEKAVAAGALDGRCVAILPYNPRPSGDCVKAMTRFVDAGGKLVVCYWLDPRIGKALGFGRAKYVKQDRVGQFAEMRFDASDVAGLPASARQASWNIMAAEPTGHNARVIGRWCDDAGREVGKPAVLLSDRGALVTHVLLPDDAEAKRRLLAALLGRLAPPLWRQMAQTKLENAGRVGHCANMTELTDYWKSISANVEQECQRARQMLRRAEQQIAQDRGAEAVASAREARDLLVQTYLRTAGREPAKRDAPEGRAVWNHSGTGAYPGDWDRSAKLLAANGFNMVLPNMLWGGVAHYPSDVLPRSDTFRKFGDQIEQCCAAAKRHGLEVHVWKVNYNLANAPKEFVEEMRRAGRTQVSVQGKPIDWLCPSHPDNQKLELDSLLEVARKYPIDGLHFDYIRYPDGSCCYCDGCRRRFEAQSGRKVLDANWPKTCFSGARKEEYRAWRCRQITSLVAAVSREARKLRPGLKISAAVFGAYPSCRDSIGQDWVEWVAAGYLDFICPMDYTTDDQAFVRLVRNQTEQIGGRIPLYPGIGATATGIAMTPDRVAGQIHWARSLGAAGWTIFDFDSGTAASIVPGIGLGAGARRVDTPHHTP